jgi:hypothetical protein
LPRDRLRHISATQTQPRVPSPPADSKFELAKRKEEVTRSLIFSNRFAEMLRAGMHADER